MKQINKRDEGKKQEETACKYLEMKGIHIIKKNYFVKQGEIDIIAKDKEYLVFIEVKYRRNNFSGNPLEAVTKAKQKKICKASLFFLNENKIDINRTCIRFDVIGIEANNIVHIENAFEFTI